MLYRFHDLLYISVELYFGVIFYRSSFFMVQGDQEKVQGMVHGAEKSFCTGNTLMRLSGLNTCIRARFPNASDDAPHFPLTGPVTINVDTTNEDLPHGYKFELRRTSVCIQFPVLCMSKWLKEFCIVLVGLAMHENCLSHEFAKIPKFHLAFYKMLTACNTLKLNGVA